MINRKIIVIIIIIYFLMFAIKLDDLDRLGIYTAIKYSGKMGDNNMELYKKIIYILKFLTIPFQESTYIAFLTSGTIYSVISFDINPILAQKMCFKMYWSDIFSVYNINHPLTYLYKDYKKIYQYRKIIPEDYYVIKPNDGGCGNGVVRIKGSKVEEYIKSHNNIIVQQSLKDCIGVARHFRYITLYDGSEFTINMRIQKNPNIVTSNVSTGAITTICYLNKCPGLNKVEELALKNTCKKLRFLHKKLYNSIFSIGWDVMLNCNNGTNSKAYALEGNVDGAWCCHGAYQSCRDKIYYKEKIFIYKKKLKKFLKMK